MSKLCTVIIPTRNRPQSLLLAVRSALAALPTNSEIIVIDDGSDQKAREVLRDLASDSLRVIENPPPHGPSQARNLGLRLAKGKTIFFLDDDDELLPHYLKEILLLREKLPDGCAYGFSSALQKIPNGVTPFKKKRRPSGVYDKTSALSDRLAGLGMGFWVDRNTMLDLGGLDNSLRVNEDTEFCIRLASSGYCCYNSENAGVILVGDERRAKNEQTSITKSSTSLTRTLGFEYILVKHSSFLSAHRRLKRNYVLRILKYRWRSKSVQGWKEFVEKSNLGWAHLILKLVVTPILMHRAR